MKFLKCFVVLAGAVMLVACADLSPPASLQMYANTSRHRQELVDQLRDRGVQVVQVGDGLRVVLFADRFFITNTELNPKMQPLMAAVTDLLKTYAPNHIFVVGHTDEVGSVNKRLVKSKTLAHTVAAYLWAQGIPLSTMTIKGESNNRSIASNETVNGSAANRRVEICVAVPSNVYVSSKKHVYRTARS